MSEMITTAATLESLIGKPSPLVHLKSINHLDDGALGWLAASPLIVAGFGRAVGTGVTLGGGEPGWVQGKTHALHLPLPMLDDQTCLEPGRSFGSIFLIPSITEILRVNGKISAVHADSVSVAVEECYFHCGKALIRSSFWDALPLVSGAETAAALAAESSFLALNTVDAEGHADTSPKGDPTGMMAQIDGDTLWFADRPGNKRIDSFRNIVTQPRVSAILLRPGSVQTLRVSGTARITADEAIRAAFAVGEKIPELVTGITLDTVEIIESAALVRARLWPAKAAPAEVNPAKIVIGHMKLAKGVADEIKAKLAEPGAIEKSLEHDYKENLY